MYSIRTIILVIALLVIHSGPRLAASAGTYPMPESARKAWGYIDHTGRYVITPQFDSAADFSCGAAAVAPDQDRYSDYNDLQYDYIDKTGKLISHDFQSRQEQLHCGLCPRKGDSGWGYVNAQGTFKIAPRFEEALEFSNDLAPVTEKGSLEIIDTEGKIVWSEASAKMQASPSDEDSYVVIDLAGPAFYAWRQSKKLQFGGWFAQDEEIVPADSKPMQNCYGYLDRKGQWAIPPKFFGAAHFSEELASVTEKSAATGGEWCEYFIDKTGKTQITLPKSARSAGDFHEGIASVYLNQSDPQCALSRKQDTGSCGFIDKFGKFVIPAKYTSLARSFSEGLAAASIGSGESERWGFIDREQHVVIPFIFGYAGNFSQGRAAVCTAKEKAASISTPSALEVDSQIRERILKICLPYHFSSFRIQLDISNGALQRISLRKGTGDASLDTKLVSALQRLKLPPWSPELASENYPNYLVTPSAVIAASTVEDPDKQKSDEAKILRDQLILPQEHADWKRKQTLLERYLSIEMRTDDNSWSNECDELIRLYRQQGDLKKARNLAESAYKLSKENGWTLAEIAEEGGDLGRAEAILKDEVSRVEKKDQGKQLQTNVRPWRIPATIALANFYYRQKRFHDAEELYTILAKEIPYLVNDQGEKIPELNLQDRYRLSVFYLDRGKIETAEKLFSQLLKDAEKAPNSPGVDDHYLNYLALLQERYPDKFEKYKHLTERTQSSDGTALWGAVDTSGHFVIPPTFDGLGWFDEGVAPAQLANRWGYIDPAGRWKIFPQFALALPFSEGLAAVSRRFQPFPLDSLDKQFEKLTFIDKNSVCRLQTNQDFGIDGFSLFSEGLAGVAVDTGENDHGYIDKSGKVVIARQFHEVPPFKDGIAKPSIATSPITSTGLGVEQYEVVINKDQATLLKPQLDKPARPATDDELINPFAITLSDANSGTNDGGGGAKTWGYRTLDGTIVIKPTFDEARSFTESVAAVRIKEHWGYIDRSGKIILPATYDTANAFIDGLAIINDHDKTHFIDHSGHDPFDGKYNAVMSFSADRSAVSTDGGVSYSLINRQGHQMTDVKFRRVGLYASGLAPAQPVSGDSNRWGYIDLNGNMAIPAIFDQAQEFHGNLAVVRFQRDLWMETTRSHLH